MIFFRIMVILHMGMKMINHCISYILFNERTSCKRIIFLFMEIIATGCEFGVMIVF
jgi:hypothetical protein